MNLRGCAAILSAFAVIISAMVGMAVMPGDIQDPIPSLDSDSIYPVINSGPGPQVRWGQYATLDPSAPVNATEMADINQDGYIDIVSAADNTGLKVWLGDGTGNWTSATSPVAVGVFADIAVGDINNDGAPDIVGGKNGGILAWCKNKTTGGWNAFSTGLPITRQYRAVGLTDYNNDGNLDIVAGGTAGGPNRGVIAYKGNGKGTWVLQDNGLPLSGSYNSVALADLNKDGAADIAAASNSGVDTWMGDGKGNWTLRDSGLPAVGSYTDVEVYDVNLDGNQDLVTTSGMGAGMRVWSGDGTGVWTMRLGLPTTGDYSGLQMADVNLDGFTDVVASSVSNNQTVWTGDGSYGWYLQTIGLSATCYFKGVSLGDIDRDGRLDFCGPGETGGIGMWCSSVERTANSWLPYGTPATAATINDIVILDVNLDGKLDISYATQANGLLIYTGNGAGAWASFTSPSATGTYFTMRSCDFNRDGKPDIVAATSAGIMAWTGNGAGMWNLRTSGLPNTGAWFSIAADDLNDDGMTDIITGSGQGSGMRVYSGDGTGVWTMRLGLPMSANFHDIAVGDANRDGDSDLMLASSTGVRCYLGNGAFNWTQVSTGLPTGANYRNIEIADLNRDAYLDILAADSGAEGTKGWTGNANGSWAYHSQMATFSSRGFASGDVNLDGITDAVVGANASARGIMCEIQTGTGWANLSSGLPTSGDYRTLKLADINIDGILDILASNGTSAGSKIWVAGYSSPPAPWFNITVVAGWNLVSIPLVSANESLLFALADKANDGSGFVQWSRVMWRNPSSLNDPWKQYNTAWPDAMNDLKNVQSHMGVWLFVTSVGDGKICLGGSGYSELSGTAIPLKAGWNLVGYPSATGGDTIAGLKSQCPSVDIVEGFSEAAIYKTWTPPDSYALVRGEGYWIHSTADTVWNIP